MNRRQFLRRAAAAAGLAFLAPSLARPSVAAPAAPPLPPFRRDDAAWLQGQLNALRPGQTLYVAPGVYLLQRALVLPPGRGIDGRHRTMLVSESMDSGALLTAALRNPGGPLSVVRNLYFMGMGRPADDRWIYPELEPSWTSS